MADSSETNSGDRLSEHKTFSDSIHGHITLPPLCLRIIDTPQFQRLRYICQLAGNYYVFPGASHNRFEHSLGVCHLAGEMVRMLQSEQPELGITAADKLCVQIAGLCHDLGHGPFSHLFDKMFIPAACPGVTWRHEDCSGAMFDHLLEENEVHLKDYGLAEPEDRTFIKELIMGPEKGKTYKSRTDKKEFLHQIVANKETGIDVDKWDYFARDCHGLGIRCSFDHARLLKFTRAIEGDGGRWNICFRDKEVSNIYDMFHTRELLHRRAYQHKTSVAIEMMISEALLAANTVVKIRGLRMSECINDMEAYTQLDDRILYTIMYSSDPDLNDASQLLQRIQKRDLYRCVGQTKPRKGCYMAKDDKTRAEESILNVKTKHKGISLTSRDIFLSIPSFDFGMKEANPVAHVRFYSKHDPRKSMNISQSQLSHMLPECFRDQFIRCYCRSSNRDTINEARHRFVEWCKDNKDVDTVEVSDGYQNIV